jgi:hypothetical protein
VKEDNIELLSDYEKWIWIIDWGSPQLIIDTCGKSPRVFRP